jgi:hypothetical protein
MHENSFSSIRDFLLDHTTTLIQDDSGIPCSFFAPEMWNMTFFGSYPGPVPLFKEYRQSMLGEYYKTTNPGAAPSETPLRALPVPEENPPPRSQLAGCPEPGRIAEPIWISGRRFL